MKNPFIQQSELDRISRRKSNFNFWTLFITIALLIATATLNAQVYASIETGYLNRSLSLRDSETYIGYQNKNSFYSDLEFGYRIKRFHIESNIISIFNKSHSVYFSPKLAKYDIRLYYKHKNIEFGYEHSCTHPVMSNDINMKLFRVSHDKLFVKFRFGKL